MPEIVQGHQENPLAYEFLGYSHQFPQLSVVLLEKEYT